MMVVKPKHVGTF